MNYITPSIFPDSIICAYSTKTYGEVAPFRERGDGLTDMLSEETIVNRDVFSGDAGISLQEIVQLKQFHSDKVVDVSSANAGTGYVDEADAMITDEPGVALSLFTSDCLPVFFYDPVRNVIAVAHAGWRGVYSEILLKTIAKMKKNHKSAVADLWVWIGPSVSGKSYCFGIEHFNDSPANAYFESMGGITRTEENFCVDLKQVALAQLIGSGVSRDQIEISDIDTKTDERFFSYQDGDRSNNMGIIMMQN